MKTLVIIPAYNEEDSIGSVIDGLKKVSSSFDILVINDASTDRTSSIAKEKGVLVLDMPVNMGIGGAIQTGYRYALEFGYDNAVQVDADGQHRPEELPKMCDKINSEKTDMVIASRFLSHGGFKTTIPRRAGIRYFSSLIYLLTGKKITDPTSGYRIIGKKLIRLFSENYAEDYPEPESAVFALKKGLSVTELPTHMHARTAGVSSITPFRAIYYMIKVTIAIFIRSLSAEQTPSEIQKTFYDKKFKKIATHQMSDNLADFYAEKIISILNENLDIKKNSAVLEVGVGEGLLMKKMTGRFKDCVFKGIDISEKNIRSAGDKGLDVELADADRLALPQKYDLIYGTSMLHHLEDIHRFFKDAAGTLNTGGVIIFGGEPVFYEFFYIIYHFIRRQWEIEKGMLNISVKKIKRYLEDDYKNIKIYRHGNNFVYLSRSIGRLWNASGLSKIPFLNDIYIYAEKR